MLIPTPPAVAAPARPIALIALLALVGGCGDGGSSPADQGPRDSALPDAGTPDERWAHCPPASDFVGETSWPITLDVTAGATYCTRAAEWRTLQEELAAKWMLRVVPGAYRLPASADTYPFLLPLCLADADGPGPTLSGDASSITHTSSIYEQDTYHQLHFQQALTSGYVSGQLSPVQRASTYPSPVLDGSPADPFGESGFTFGFALCLSGDCLDGGELYFDSCTHATSSLQQHHVLLEGGSEVHFELRIGQSPAGTEPAAFVRAHGQFEGVSFDQRDYFKLVYNPSHHHFERHFAVLFDAPIDGVCGIEVEGLEPWDDYQPDLAYAVDCALERLSELDVSSHTWES